MTEQPYSLLRPVATSRPTSAPGGISGRGDEHVGRAMLGVARRGAQKPFLENEDIEALGAAAPGTRARRDRSLGGNGHGGMAA